MADFCKQCSMEIFGEDFGDMANLGKLESGDLEKLKRGEGWSVLCEDCGSIVVNEEGECIAEWCKKHGASTVKLRE